MAFTDSGLSSLDTLGVGSIIRALDKQPDARLNAARRLEYSGYERTT